jgi:hypothetical protein
MNIWHGENTQEWTYIMYEQKNYMDSIFIFYVIKTIWKWLR